MNVSHNDFGMQFSNLCRVGLGGDANVEQVSCSEQDCAQLINFSLELAGEVQSYKSDEKITQLIQSTFKESYMRNSRHIDSETKKLCEIIKQKSDNERSQISALLWGNIEVFESLKEKLRVAAKQIQSEKPDASHIEAELLLQKYYLEQIIKEVLDAELGQDFIYQIFRTLNRESLGLPQEIFDCLLQELFKNLEEIAQAIPELKRLPENLRGYCLAVYKIRQSSSHQLGLQKDLENFIQQRIEQYDPNFALISLEEVSKIENRISKYNSNLNLTGETRKEGKDSTSITHAKDKAPQPKVSKTGYLHSPQFLRALENGNVELFRNEVIVGSEKSAHEQRQKIYARTEASNSSFCFLEEPQKIRQQLVTTCDDKGFALIHYAIQFGRTECISAIVECGGDVNQLTSEAEHPISLLFSLHGHDPDLMIRMLEVLLQHGAIFPGKLIFSATDLAFNQQYDGILINIIESGGLIGANFYCPEDKAMDLESLRELVNYLLECLVLSNKPLMFGFKIKGKPIEFDLSLNKIIITEKGLKDVIANLKKTNPKELQEFVANNFYYVSKILSNLQTEELSTGELIIQLKNVLGILIKELTSKEVFSLQFLSQVALVKANINKVEQKVINSIARKQLEN